MSVATGMPECDVNEVSRSVGKGVWVPLSEEEQRILQEMEQKLYEHDREFVDRVNHGAHRLQAAKGAKWSVVGCVAGFALLLFTFRFSIALGALGFFLMLVSLLVFAQHIRQASAAPVRASRQVRTQALAGELSAMRRRIRSRFGHRD